VRRDELEHVIAAAADVTGETELVVVGSQAILGPFPDAPQSMLRSMEADLYPRRAPEKADDIDGSLGDGSRFHRTFGYYAHGVGPETAKAPAGWEMRCSRSASQTASGIGSSRAKALAHRLVDTQVLLGRIDDLRVEDEHRRDVRARLEALAALT